MNLLPVDPHHISKHKTLQQYFDNVDRWRFDVACCVYRAFDYDEVVGSLKTTYTAFAKEAKRREMTPCIRVHSTLCRGDRVPISEAQYHKDNTPDRLGNQGFFASFASTSWGDYLKELTSLFVEDCGFEWVIYDDPIWRVDIPGTSDRFHEVFEDRYPDLQYPAIREESTSYLTVQKLKADLLVEFCDELTAHAKSAGAAKVGIRPGMFTPSIGNAPAETLNTSCDVGRLHWLENVDFLAAGMRPGSLLAGSMRTGDDTGRSPLLYYPETLAHAIGKPVMATESAVDEHTEDSSLPLIPLDFFKQSTVAALAAAPNGITCDSYAPDSGDDTEYMDFLAQTNAVISRLGSPVSPVAFVVSRAGCEHASPSTYERTWQSYWALARRMLLEEHKPILTLNAETLALDLASHPEVQVLVLADQFPLTPSQGSVVRKWWTAAPRRAVLAFSGDAGYCADATKPGERRAEDAFPGLLSVMGVKEDPGTRSAGAHGASLRYVASVKRSAFLKEPKTITEARMASVGRLFGAGATVLYTDAQDNPVVIELRQRGSISVFCGFQLGKETAEFAAKAVGYALATVRAPKPAISDCSPEVLWNETRAGYLIVTNCSTEQGIADLNTSDSLLWDVIGQREVPRQTLRLEMPPLSFRIFRRARKRAKLYDIEGAMWVSNIVDGAGRADISMMAGRKTAFWMKTVARDILVDGQPSLITLDRKPGACLITLLECPPGDHEITLRW